MFSLIPRLKLWDEAKDRNWFVSSITAPQDAYKRLVLQVLLEIFIDKQCKVVGKGAEIKATQVS